MEPRSCAPVPCAPVPPAISTLCLHGTEASHATRDEQKGGAEERDALLHNGEHMSASLAAELDSYLVQVLVRCGMAPCVFTPVDTASPHCRRCAAATAVSVRRFPPALLLQCI